MIKRLIQNDHDSWRIYPTFRARVTDFATKYCPEFDASPLIFQMDKRWIETPDLAGYWVGIHDGEVYAHLASWIHKNYGKNELYIYQAEADKNFANFDLLWPQVQAWIEKLNSEPGLPEDQKVKTFEFTTMHHGDIWKRYFARKGLNPEFRTVVRSAII